MGEDGGGGKGNNVAEMFGYGFQINVLNLSANYLSTCGFQIWPSARLCARVSQMLLGQPGWPVAGV